MSSHSAVDDALLQRVYGDFAGMPGLRLTCHLAQRLWGVDAARCLKLLESLVDARFTQLNGLIDHSIGRHLMGDERSLMVECAPAVDLQDTDGD